MPDHIEFVEELIYGSRLAPEPNHRDWVDANPAPSGSAWISHHLDLLLPSFKAWLVIEHLPPLQAWDGRVTQPWGPSGIVELTGGLDGSWTGIADLNDLGAALFARFATVAGQALELNGRTKAPFSYRFWGYLQWAWTVRERFLGRQVFPVGTVFDRDGTPLSSLRFTDAFNTGHRAWHGAGTPAVAATPGFRSTAGQVSTRGLISNSAEDFIVFHREHTELFQRWLERQGQPRLRPVDMGGPDGWPESGPVPPVPPPPWAATEAAVTPVSALHGINSLSEIGSIEPDYHGRGHVRNSDLRSLPHNNYSPRFHQWHAWIDAQWWWREPRFVDSDPASGARARHFGVVMPDGSPLRGLPALSIVRDLGLTADAVHPAGAITGLDLTTGAGILNLGLYVRDPFSRTLRMRLLAEVLDHAGTTDETVEVIRDVGPAGDQSLVTPFVEPLAFNGAFASDDPNRMVAIVGFIHARIRVTGTLWVPDPGHPDDPASSLDPGFVHTDVTCIDLVHEKQPPEVTLYLDRSAFSLDQVNAVRAGEGTAHFPDSFLVAVQDRTSPAQQNPVWPTAVLNEAKGLILGRQPAAGLFDDIAHAP